jgi:muramoyltetrapeptide carboxypeptidase
MGYSDVTVLLQFLENQCGMVCFHGPMVAFEFARGQGAYEGSSLQDALFENEPGWKVVSPRVEIIQGGNARGVLTGGCLSLLCALLGTPFEMETRDRILFLEDIEARPYQIDRMLTHLKLAGKFEGVRGIVFGEMIDCSQGSGQDYSLPEILAAFFKESRFPIVYGFPSGHVKEGMITLPFGLPVDLDADLKTLRFAESATA